MKRNNTGILIIILFLYSLHAKAQQQWIVPPDKAKMLSSSPFTEETRKAGEAAYISNCKSCHGDPGKNNVINLPTPPPDPAGEKMQQNTDGELMYKIREGHGLMPPFKNTLSTTVIWDVISYFRSFNKTYKQELAQKAVLKGKTVIKLKWNGDQKKVETVLQNETDNVVKTLEGEEIQLFAERYFGDLPIDKTRTTDKDGRAQFDFPTDLPGDTAGNILVYAKMGDEAKFGEVRSDTVLKAGIPTWKPPLNEPRAMWNVVQKTPLWLLFSYVGVVLSIWGFIFYVIYLLRLIYLTGKQNDVNRDLKI